MLVHPILILNPAIKILSRDGRIRAIRRPRSNARRRDSKFLKSQRGCYIFQILLYFPNIPKVKTAVFLVKYQNPRGQDPSNPLRNTLVCRHFLISFLKSSHQKITFQISVGIFAQTAHFGNCQNLENVYNVFSENTPLKKCPNPIC